MHGKRDPNHQGPINNRSPRMHDGYCFWLVNASGCVAIVPVLSLLYCALLYSVCLSLAHWECIKRSIRKPNSSRERRKLGNCVCVCAHRKQVIIIVPQWILAWNEDELKNAINIGRGGLCTFYPRRLATKTTTSCTIQGFELESRTSKSNNIIHSINKLKCFPKSSCCCVFDWPV